MIVCAPILAPMFQHRIPLCNTDERADTSARIARVQATSIISRRGQGQTLSLLIVARTRRSRTNRKTTLKYARRMAAWGRVVQNPRDLYRGSRQDCNARSTIGPPTRGGAAHSTDRQVPPVARSGLQSHRTFELRGKQEWSERRHATALRAGVRARSHGGDMTAYFAVASHLGMPVHERSPNRLDRAGHVLEIVLRTPAPSRNSRGYSTGSTYRPAIRTAPDPTCVTCSL